MTAISVEKNPSEARLKELDVESWEERKLRQVCLPNINPPAHDPGRRWDRPWIVPQTETWYLLEGRAAFRPGGEVEPGDLVHFHDRYVGIIRVLSDLRVRCRYGTVDAVPETK
jgi:hypothetical protein